MAARSPAAPPPTITMSCARVSTIALEPVEHDGPLDFLDGLGDLDAARAGLGAVEHRPASEDPGLPGEEIEALACSLVARVEDESVRVHDRGGTDVSVVTPEDRARRGARRAQDALGRVVVALSLFRRLAAFAVRRLVVVDQEWQDPAVALEEGLH